jgi:ankyrin repeat protein
MVDPKQSRRQLSLPVLIFGCQVLFGCALSGPEEPWHQPCRDGNTKQLKVLISNGLSPNAQDVNGDTPLTYALQEKRWDTADFLMSVGADPKIVNNNSKTVIECVSSTSPSINLEPWLKKHGL